MSLSGDILSDMQMDASIEAIGEIAGSINLDGSGSTPTITASATVSPDPGIPACNVVKTGTDEYPNFAFNFSGLKGEPGEQGLPGQNGQNGADGSDGITPNLTATASVGASTGTPAVTVTRIGTDENPNFYFQFDNLKGEQGIQGEQGEPGSQGAPGSVPNVSASASVTNTSGTPAVTVTRTGSDAAPNFDFAFENLKGEQGIQGVPGQNGQNGADGSDGVTPIVSATASADNSYGIPNVVVTRSGTDVAPSFDFAFHNIKGEPGTSGVPAGGATGQVLAKESNDDWDCDWQTLVIPSTAAEINFDNTGTGMTATDVQDAVTELKSNLIQLLPNINSIYIRKQSGTFTNGVVTGLDCPSGFDSSSLVFFSAKYQNSVHPILTPGLSSATPPITTYTLYGSNARGGAPLANGTYEWFELWVNLES